VFVVQIERILTTMRKEGLVSDVTRKMLFVSDSTRWNQRVSVGCPGVLSEFTVSHILTIILLCQKGLTDIDDQVQVLRQAFTIATKCQKKASAKSKNATAGKGKRSVRCWNSTACRQLPDDITGL